MNIHCSVIESAGPREVWRVLSTICHLRGATRRAERNGILSGEWDDGGKKNFPIHTQVNGKLTGRTRRALLPQHFNDPPQLDGKWETRLQ